MTAHPHASPPRRSFVRSWALAPFLFLLTCCLAASASAQVISNNFDDTSTQGWGPRGGVAVTSSTDAARSGTHSLKTTGRTANWNGPALDLNPRLALNATYQVTGWVRLVTGQPASDLKFTLERTPAGGTTNYTQVTAPATVTDGAWVMLTGTLTLPAEQNSACTLYLESSDPTSAYYLDDFTVVSLTVPGCPEPFDQSGLATDFESGTFQGWFARGPAVLENSTADPRAGSRSLAVTGRTASWQGPGIDALCKLHKGSKYRISVWAKLFPGETATELRVSLQAGLAGATTYMTVVGNTMVSDAAWVNLSTEYTFGSDVDQLQLYVESASGTPSFYIDDFSLVYLPALPVQQDIPSLKDVLEPYFPIGAAVDPQNLVGAQRELLLKHFDQITAGNSMKWDALQPQEGVFNWTRADALANFARDNGLRMRGHTLLWHSQVPDWVFEDAEGNPLQPGNAGHRTLLLQRLETHIHAVVTRYADIVDSWDVVNEVIDANGPNGLRDSLWLQIVGPEYIDWAFEYASEVAGDAALYINDYSTTDVPKRAALQNVVQGLLDRGVPVHGVGHQMHHNIQWPSMNDIRQTLLLFAGMGLMNEVTELDISVYTNNTDTSPPTQQQLVQQGFVYRDTFNVFRELSSIINSVTVWGLGDDSSWLKTFPITRDDKPLPFDEQLQAKPAYWGIVDPSQLPIVPKELNVTRVARVIVGQLELFWSSLAPQALTSNGVDGSWAQFRTVWKGDRLYVLAEVSDTSRSSMDKVEIYVGEKRYSFRSIGLTRQSGAESLSLPTRNGYILFASISVGEALALGDTLLFDIRATDSSNAKRVSWSDTNHNQDTDTANLGTLTITGEKRVARTIRGTAVIDGLEDAAWKKADAFQAKTFVVGTSGATARVRTMWDNGNLYLFAEVTDPVLSKASPNVWEQDSIEIFVDANNAQTMSYESDDSQFRVNFDNERSYGGGASASRIVSATRRTATGYVVEAAIAVTGLTNDSFVGFDLQVNNDAAGDGVRTSVSTWNDTTGAAYLDPSQFGALHLVRTNR